jgi:radical SAM protein
MSTAAPIPSQHQQHQPRDYALAPMNVYWEMTQACALACRHCRASAQPQPHPNQLNYDESVSLLYQIVGFGDPLPQLILTGGDPLARPDLFDLIDEGNRLGIPMSITPAATPRLTRGVLEQLQQHGIAGLGLSLDGSTPERHDAIRGIAGCYEQTLAAVRWAGALGMPLQVNTLVTAETAPDLPAIYELLKPLHVKRWSLFFLISVGRGRVLQPLDPIAAEDLMRWVYATARSAPFIVATTEAPSYRRVALGELRAASPSAADVRRDPIARSFGIRDGHGIVFVSHTGEICPAGFLPLAAGNVRTDHLVEAYRNAPLFRGLHAPERFGGKCGRCEYRAICGGSRARAYAASGDPLASDPLCAYEPAARN